MLKGLKVDDELATIQANQISWLATYSITCMYAGSERNHTFNNSKSFVLEVYDAIQAERTSERFNNTVFDLECSNIELGRSVIEFEDSTIVDGGNIQLDLIIIENRD